MIITRALLVFIADLFVWVILAVRLYAMIGAATFVISGS